MKLSKLNILLISVIFVWIILAIIFGIFDLQISIAFVDENSAWGNFGADYGEVPGYGLIAIALATYIGGYIPNIKMQKILCIIGVVVGVIYLMLGMGDSDVTDISLGWILILSLGIYMVITWNKDWKDFRKISGLISILAILYPLLLVQIMKLLWGRVRFRDLAPGYVDFTPWFLPQGFTDNYSFPSGHTAMSFMLIPLLIPLSNILSEKGRKKVVASIMIVIVIGWALFVGASRIVVGAHYSSDVLFSGGAACIITILLYKRYYLKRAT